MYTQSILHLKYCIQKNFIFENFIFENFIFENFIFRKFYQILFDFAKKKFRKYCSQLTGQCYYSLVLFAFTVHSTVHGYCWSQYKKLYYNTFPAAPCCLAIQFPFPCLAIQFPFYATIQSNTSCNTLSSQPTTQPCNTICCIAIQFPILKPSSLQYKNCIAIQSTSLAHPRPLYHNTMPLLQYKNFFSQYNMGSSPKRFSTKKNSALIFFFLFHYYCYYYFFHLFPALGKITKITKKIVFFSIFLDTQIHS